MRKKIRWRPEDAKFGYAYTVITIDAVMAKKPKKPSVLTADFPDAVDVCFSALIFLTPFLLNTYYPGSKAHALSISGVLTTFRFFKESHLRIESRHVLIIESDEVLPDEDGLKKTRCHHLVAIKSFNNREN